MRTVSSGVYVLVRWTILGKAEENLEHTDNEIVWRILLARLS